MTTAVTERSSLGKISWNRMIAKSRASGNVARRDGLPEYVEPWSVSGPLHLYMERVIEDSEVNLRLGRFLGQMAPANGALQLIGRTAGLLTESPQTQVAITKVTVVLKHGNEDNVIEGERVE